MVTLGCPKPDETARRRSVRRCSVLTDDDLPVDTHSPMCSLSQLRRSVSSVTFLRSRHPSSVPPPPTAAFSAQWVITPAHLSHRGLSTSGPSSVEVAPVRCGLLQIARGCRYAGFAGCKVCVCVCVCVCVRLSLLPSCSMLPLFYYILDYPPSYWV